MGTLTLGNLSVDAAREFLDRLGFVLVVDNCRRGCLHCPAYGTTSPVRYMSATVMAQLLSGLDTLFRDLGVSKPRRTIQCWRLSDPLDYHFTIGRRLYDVIYVAEMWLLYLDQGIYFVTNGSEGRETAQAALRAIARRPELVSQAKLTITPYDVLWGTDRYRQDLLDDIEILAPLWSLRSVRIEDHRNALFRINIKTAAAREPEARDFVYELLRTLSLDADSLIEDSTRVCFKPIYDLGTTSGAASPVPGAIKILNERGERYKPVEGRTQVQTGIGTDLSTFKVDMYAFADLPMTDHQGAPVTVSLE